MRHAARVDANQAEIVAALRAVGATVDWLKSGDDKPDLLVGYRGNNYLLEVKQPGEYPTDGQIGWITNWEGRAKVVFSAEEALREIGAM